MLFNFTLPTDDLIKVALSVLCGGLLGIERQYKNKTAGFRTMILICLGSTLYTLVAQRTGVGVNINIVTGIGFIGAGVIFKDNISVNGLTTAAVIWVSAAIGMAIGTNNYLLAIISSLLTIFVLWLFHYLENYMDKVHYNKQYSFVFADSEFDNIELVEEMIKSHHLRSFRVQINKHDDNLLLLLKVTGHRKNIAKLDREFLAMNRIKSF
jgi:putative Mg2+ transporter-C (MgtC) family protein